MLLGGNYKYKPLGFGEGDDGTDLIIISAGLVEVLEVYSDVVGATEEVKLDRAGGGGVENSMYGPEVDP